MSGVLDARQCLVDGECAGDVLHTLSLERIPAEAANESQWTRSNDEQKASTDKGC